MSRGAPDSGMTLLELLVAMAIFTLVATAAYAALQQGLQIQDRLQEKRTFWQRLETTLDLMGRDLRQARARPPRAPAREWSLAFQGRSQPGASAEGRLFRFTRGGHTSFREGPVSPFLRIAYGLRDGSLFRVIWPRVDAPAGDQGREAVLMEGVEAATVQYLGPAGRGRDRWPPPAGGDAEVPALPRAVEVTLRFQGRGTFKRVFHVGAPR